MRAKENIRYLHFTFNAGGEIHLEWATAPNRFKMLRPYKTPWRAREITTRWSTNVIDENMTELKRIPDDLIATSVQMLLERILNMEGQEKNCKDINEVTLVESVFYGMGLID